MPPTVNDHHLLLGFLLLTQDWYKIDFPIHLASSGLDECLWGSVGKRKKVRAQTRTSFSDNMIEHASAGQTTALPSTDTVSPFTKTLTLSQTTSWLVSKTWPSMTATFAYEFLQSPTNRCTNDGFATDAIEKGDRVFFARNALCCSLGFYLNACCE